jgi:hypothetical protein
LEQIQGAAGPVTHLLKHSSRDLKRLSFLVWSFGFFVGMRMSDQEMGFLDAAAPQRGASNDLVWFEADLGRGFGEGRCRPNAIQRREFWLAPHFRGTYAAIHTTHFEGSILIYSNIA